jgi:cellulose synthase/poly-beta-1,6-N-acetylglucosamine synthase-like glycosyltransferase
MLESVVFILQALYGLCAVGLAIYSLHAVWLVWQVRRAAPATTRTAPAIWPAVWPTVTVQLPIYNERHVVERLIEACAALDYPRDRLQIQVLDDSSDDTMRIVDRSVTHWQAQGCDISAVRRADRRGYKAGALAHALPLATGDFVAVFDADFRPAPDFLRCTVPYFLTPDATQTGFVQTRWGHLNRDYSPLTRSQALALDGHFAVEQAGRQAAGYFFGFNGSGGIWRRACIEDAQTGGWQDDTLCEDLDLSYRAQLAGWRACYVNEIIAPAEIPPQLNAYKRQQFRWAKGSIQTLRKLGGRVWRSGRAAPVRGAAMIHLGSYLIHPMLLLLLLTIPPLLLLGGAPPSPIALVGFTSFGPPLLYAVGQQRLYGKNWWRRWIYLPLLTLLGMGVCLSNSLAVWQGLRTRGGVFQRTPKFRVEQSGDAWWGSTYRLPLDRMMMAEIGLMIYALVAAWLVAQQSGWMSAFFMLLYAAGFAAVISVSLWQNRPPHLLHRFYRRRFLSRTDPGKYNTPLTPDGTI